MKTTRIRIGNICLWALAISPLLATSYAHAGTTDIAQVPLFTSASSTVKPNIMFILDDSGSMASDYMPDDSNFASTKYGKLSPQCNGLAYNPRTTYSLPVDSTGTPLAAGSGAFNNADPTQLTSKFNLTPATVSIVGSGDIGPFTVSSGSPGWSVGSQVTVFNSGDTVHYMTGTVKTFSGSQLTLTVNGSVGTGSLIINQAASNSPTLPYYYAYSGSQTAMSYIYSASGVDTTTTFYNECNSTLNASPGNAVFTKVNMSAASSDAQNYQNWYTYYHTRIKMMKSAMSIAFKPLTDKYRVGFTSISSKTAAPGTKFLDINTFDATHKAAFYTALTAAAPGGNTPLRGALSKAGQYFAKMASGQTSDPIQYSCQKNFTILSTDGYWNTGAETTTYGSFDVAGNKVGQQDATEDRPMRDSAVASSTTVKTWETTRTVVSQTANKTTSYTNASVTTTSTYGTGSGVRSDTYTGTLSTSTMTSSCTSSPKTCTATVTMSAAHGLAAGASIYVRGAAPSVYNGLFTVLAVVNSTQFTYKFTYPGGNPGAVTTKGTVFVQGSCSAGQVRATDSSTQTDTFPLTISTTTSATATDVTTYTQTQTVTVTPYTQTTVVVNGVTTSDTTVAGTPVATTTTLPPPATTTSAPYPYSSGTTTAAGASNVQTTTGTTSVCVMAPTNTSNVSVAVVTTAPTNTSSAAATTLANVVASPVTTTPTDTTVAGAPTSTVTPSSSGGSSNSLADVAEYYFKTDLRSASLNNCQGALGTGTDVCGTTVSNPMQNMITFTIGLGTSGTLKYDPNYKKQTSGDYFELTQGTKVWPIPTDSSNGGDPTNIDDLWHAAVNGRGQYFSAGDPNEVVKSLSAALLQISVITGSSSAAATSTLQPVAGDNDVFVAQFTSGKWIGDVVKYSIDPTTGGIDTTTAAWSAAKVLDAQISAGTARTIYYFKPGSGSTGSLRAFNYTNLLADGKNSLFDSFCSKTGAGGAAAPEQCGSLDATQTTTANSGTNLVNYLRGTENATVYRSRDSALGDIIDASPLFVGTPKFKYTENNYAGFASSQTAAFASAGVKGVVYVAANDGMLHAFDRTTGAEKWAYIPSVVMPNMYKLADTAYAANHQFFVDGSPQMGDIYVGGAWKTILVGGLNGGGRGYYALDITDPNSPKALWEFTDDQLGLTFGNPIITKRKDGTWIVAFASGYNNVSPGDGNGYLFVLNAATGAKLVSPIPTYTTGTTAAGSTTTPSGLAKINAWVDSEIDNTAKVFYGGDLLGNLWRFDVDSQVTPFASAYRLAQFVVSGVAQPITTKPQLAEVNYAGTKVKVVYVGTGRYLGTGDLSNTDLQSVYAIKDTWNDSSALGDVRTSNTLVEQKLSTDASNSLIRKAETNAVDWSTKNGWMVDLKLSTGERVNVNMSLALDVLSVATNVPTADACDAGGRSWLYKFDIATGSAVTNANDGAVGISLGNVLVAGQTVVQLADGQTVTISTLSDATLRTDKQPPPPPTNLLRRTSWRELAN
jgi:type IV pilus assembly protein PilY1